MLEGSRLRTDHGFLPGDQWFLVDWFSYSLQIQGLLTLNIIGVCLRIFEFKDSISNQISNGSLAKAT